MRVPARIAAFVGVCALAVGLSACGGEDKAADSSPSNDASSQAPKEDLSKFQGDWEFKPEKGAKTELTIDADANVTVAKDAQDRSWEGGISPADDGTFTIELHDNNSKNTAIWLISLTSTDDDDSLQAMTGEGAEGTFKRVE